MQHSSAVMGLVPMTPEMWLELELDPIQGGGSHMASVLDGLEFLRHISGGTRPITAEECYMEPGP